MKDVSDVLTVSFDSGLKDESALCVSRRCGEKIVVLKMELGEQADILYHLLTEQMTKAAINESAEEWYKLFVEKLEQTTWIPVSERLPENTMMCLVAVGRYNLTQMAIYSDLMGTIDHKIFYQGDYGYENFVDITQYVTAWMPLPEPYKEDKE